MDIWEVASNELIKIAAEQSDQQRPSYLRAVGAALPVVGMQAAADIPEGWTERAVENSVLRSNNVPMAAEPSSVRAALSRGGARVAAGLVTTPVFLSGMRDIKEGKTREQKAEGYAKVVGAGLGFSALKGTAEATLTHAGSGQGSQEVLNKIKALAGARTLIGAGSAAVTAATASELLKNQDENPGAVHRFVLPAAVGAALGAGKGAVEHAFEHGTQVPEGEPLARMKGRMAGKAAAGAVAGLAINEILRYALKPKEKKASVDGQPTGMRASPLPGEAYGHVRTWADAQPAASVHAQVQSMHTKFGSGIEATPTRRAVYYGFRDSLESRGDKNLPPGNVSRYHPPAVPQTGLADTATVAAIIATPGLIWNFGIAKLKPDDRDRVLTEALDRAYIGEGITRLKAEKDFWGNPQSLFRVDGDKKVVEVAKDAMPEVLAHELGHATMGSLRKKLTPLASGMYHMALPAAVLLPLLAVEGVPDKSFTTAEDLESRARFSTSVGVVTGLMMTPLLAEEATASVQGVRMLREVGATKGEALLRGARSLLPALATYAAPIAAPFIAAAYLRNKADKGRRSAESRHG